MEASDVIKVGAVIIGVIGFFLIGMGIMNPAAFHINSHDLVLMGTTITTQVQNIIIGFVLIVIGLFGFVYIKMRV